MSGINILTVLHISDFHHTMRKQRDQKIVVDALINDLNNLCIGHRRPDIVIFSGDLVNAGGSDRHEDAYDLLLSRISQSTGCSDERFYIAPGNHDLTRSVVEAHISVHENWRKADFLLEEQNTCYTNGDFDQILDEKFRYFNDLCRYLTDNSLVYRNAFCDTHHIAGMNIDILIINTAAFSAGGLSTIGADERFLSVPEHAVFDAIEHLSENSFRIFVTHHPLSFMSEATSRYLSQVIEKSAHMHLYGHMHDPQSRSTISFMGKLFSDQSGAVFTQRRGAYIGYSLISVERTNNHYETHLRTYFDDRKSFDSAIDVVKNGRFYSSHESSQFWRGIATPVDERALLAYLAGEGRAAVDAELDAEPANKEVRERFVPPPMKRPQMQSGSGEHAKYLSGPSVTIEDILSGIENYIIVAPPEFGRTTVLREIFYRHFSDYDAMRIPRIPILLDFCDIKHNSDNLFRLIRGRIAVTPDTPDPESILRLGYACIIIDDVDFSNERSMRILREFVSKYPKLRYIFSSVKFATSNFGSSINPEMPISFNHIEIFPLRRQEMRRLLVKFERCQDVDRMLDRIQDEIREINLPFTAANGSIFMEIYQEQNGFRPINRSVLVEQFIDTVLRKAEAGQSRRETFDYANKTALLAHIASQMATMDDYKIPEETLRSIAVAYIDRMGLVVRIDELIKEFLSARVLERKFDGYVSFRYRSMLEYFIALQMNNDLEFKNWVMEEKRYLQYVNEIQYYSGRLRNDAALVEEIGRRFEQIVTEVEAQIGICDLNRLADIRLPKNEDAVTASMLASQLAAPLNQEDLDEELNAEIPTDVENRQEVFRPSINDPGQKLIVATCLYSGVLKNMELIDDHIKRRHLNNNWRGWGIFLLTALTIVPELARLRKFRINGVLYELNAPFGMTDGELTRIISLNMPVGVSRLIAGALGSEKLERQLVEPGFDAVGQPRIYDFFRTALIADLRLPATPSALANSLDNFRVSPYLREALVWKIAELRRLNRIFDSHMDQVAEPLARAMADLKGGSKDAREERKRRELKRLNSERFLLKMQRDAGDER